MSGGDHHDEYGDAFVAGFEWMWGEGFLSPGGTDEVARIVAGAPIEGARVLDAGCGLGAIDVLLVERFGAAHVTGIDVEAPLVARAAERVEAAGMAGRVCVRKVSPGPFPFDDGAFDVVFGKDSMIHIPDKRGLYAQVHRVLAPGGWMVVSDWFGNGIDPTGAMREWLEAVGLTFRLASIEASAALVAACGFADVEWCDRNAWYAETINDEIATLAGENYPRLVEHVGAEAAARRLDSTTKRRRSSTAASCVRVTSVRASPPERSPEDLARFNTARLSGFTPEVRFCRHLPGGRHDMTISEILIRGGRIEDADPDFGYIPGFGNTHSTEAEQGALPIGRNSPQQPPLGLYAEQFSGTSFSVPRAGNRRSWLYRILPSVKHGTGFEEVDTDLIRTAPCRESELPAAQLRWHPIPIPSDGQTDFLSGLRTIATCGDAAMQAGMASHVFVANASMDRKYFHSADGELLVVPQQNPMKFLTEFGVVVAEPGEIVVIPRGVKFRVDLVDGPIRGYVCENYGMALALPERGPIGANGLANERDFLYPAAAYEDLEQQCALYLKARGRMFRTVLSHSPLDVVAWHGNCAPCKYDLRRFSPVGSTLLDHPDPSIYTVLTAASDTPGTANVDFVIFPERWLVAESSFRPPWYHMNVMSEFMGLVYGVYDAKPGGFVPGGMSLHNATIAHGPDTEAFERASTKALEPEKLAGTMAFMFETRYVLEPTGYASGLDLIDTGYPDCWDGLRRNFQVPARTP